MRRFQGLVWFRVKVTPPHFHILAFVDPDVRQIDDELPRHPISISIQSLGIGHPTRGEGITRTCYPGLPQFSGAGSRVCDQSICSHATLDILQFHGT